MNTYKQTVIKHVQPYTSCITNTNTSEEYAQTLINHVRLYTSCITNRTPIPEGPILLEPIDGWTGYENCALPPDVFKGLLITTLTSLYLVETGTGKNLIES